MATRQSLERIPILLKMKIQIRECVLGEFKPDNTTCAKCKNEQYSFNPSEDVCRQCPVGARCTQNTMIPDNSTWQSDPIYETMLECPNPQAC